MRSLVPGFGVDRSFMIRESGDICLNCYESLPELREKSDLSGRGVQLLSHFVLKSIAKTAGWMLFLKRKSHNTFLRHDMDNTLKACGHYPAIS